jgi:hypothetical protein
MDNYACCSYFSLLLWKGEFKVIFQVIFISPDLNTFLLSLAYLIKAAVNEGAKLPCFVNIIPEANHNEIQGFVSTIKDREVGNFTFLFITSPKDHPRVARRFAVMTALYHEEGFGIAGLSNDHTNHTKVFELILTGYFAATFLAIARNVDTYKTPFIVKFKDRIL